MKTNLNTKNFINEFIFNPTSNKLSKKGKVVALISTIALGIFLGIFHGFCFMFQRPIKKIKEKNNTIQKTENLGETHLNNTKIKREETSITPSKDNNITKNDEYYKELKSKYSKEGMIAHYKFDNEKLLKIDNKDFVNDIGTPQKAILDVSKFPDGKTFWIYLEIPDLKLNDVEIFYYHEYMIIKAKDYMNIIDYDNDLSLYPFFEVTKSYIRKKHEIAFECFSELLVIKITKNLSTSAS